MMNQLAHRLLKPVPLIWDILLSAAGCFVFMRYSRLRAIGEEGSDAESSALAEGRARKPLAGIGAALFLLAFVTSEALATIRALGH